MVNDDPIAGFVEKICRKLVVAGLFDSAFDLGNNRFSVTADTEWDDICRPVSKRFCGVYFSADDDLWWSRQQRIEITL
jgi:hypothetical protein